MIRPSSVFQWRSSRDSQRVDRPLPRFWLLFELRRVGIFSNSCEGYSTSSFLRSIILKRETIGIALAHRMAKFSSMTFRTSNETTFQVASARVFVETRSTTIRAIPHENDLEREISLSELERLHTLVGYLTGIRLKKLLLIPVFGSTLFAALGQLELEEGGW